MPLPKDEFDRRLDVAFSFLGDVIQHPEVIDTLPPTIHLFVGMSSFSGSPSIEGLTSVSFDTNFAAGIVRSLATAQG